MQPCSTAGPNVHNQIGPHAVAACVKLCVLENSLAAYGKLALYLKSEPFHGPQNFSYRATGWTPLLYAIGIESILILYLYTIDSGVTDGGQANAHPGKQM